MSESRKIAQRLVVGGLFGLLAALMLGIPIIHLVAGGQARRTVEEIESLARKSLDSAEKA